MQSINLMVRRKVKMGSRPAQEERLPRMGGFQSLNDTAGAQTLFEGLELFLKRARPENSGSVPFTLETPANLRPGEFSHASVPQFTPSAATPSKCLVAL